MRGKKFFSDPLLTWLFFSFFLPVPTDCQIQERVGAQHYYQVGICQCKGITHIILYLISDAIRNAVINATLLLDADKQDLQMPK